MCNYNFGYPYHSDAPMHQHLADLRDYLAAEAPEIGPKNQERAANDLETKVATLLGMESAAWFPTGVLAQGIAARIHANTVGNGELLLHPTSHLLLHEQDGYFHGHGSSAKIVGKWREPLNADDFVDAVGTAFIELPQRHSGGKLPAWDSLQAIKSLCRAQGISLHMDGARLWSCRPFYQGRSYADIAAGFDSVYVSLYKDIGAMGGAVLAGNQHFIDEAKLWRARFGGFSVGAWPMIYDALRLIDKRIAQMASFVAKAKTLAAAIEHVKSLRLDPSEPHSNLFHILLPVSPQKAAQARQTIAEDLGIWLADRFWEHDAKDSCAMEIVVGEKALATPTEVFSKAMIAFAEKLASD